MNQKYNKLNIDELKRKLDQLKIKLLDALDLWYYYQNDVSQQIMFNYDNLFGDLEDEIENKSQTAKELERKVELLQLKIKKGEMINDNTLKFVNLIVNREAKRVGGRSTTGQYSFHSKDNSNRVAQKNDNLKNLSCQVNDDYELPHLYRNLVKKLHPDVSGETADFHRFWDNLQLSYRSRDIIRLRLLSLTLCDNELESNVDNKNAEIVLKSQIYELEYNLRKQETQILNMKKQEPFSFEIKMNDKHWVAKRKNLLKEKIVQIDRRIRHHNSLLTTLTNRHGLINSNLNKSKNTNFAQGKDKVS